MLYRVFGLSVVSQWVVIRNLSGSRVIWNMDFKAKGSQTKNNTLRLYTIIEKNLLVKFADEFLINIIENV